jgi:hypothetical protein
MYEIFAVVSKVTDETQSWTALPVFCTPLVIPSYNGLNRSQERLSSERRGPREGYVCLETEKASLGIQLVSAEQEVNRLTSRTKSVAMKTTTEQKPTLIAVEHSLKCIRRLLKIGISGSNPGRAIALSCIDRGLSVGRYPV